eukprot:11352795-Karenia_brevis.AAC.1
MPPCWHGYFAYNKPVPNTIIGGDGSVDVYIALTTIPMGWHSAVDVCQEAVRHIAYSLAKVDGDTEVNTKTAMPASPPYTLIYLDGFDYIRA